jgi:phage/plasmid-like protein (TIGR03299 family)
MSANIGETDGKPSIFYTGETPWHGLGKKLEKAATAAEALSAAGLDWKVTKEPIYLAGGQKIERQYATVRSDTKKALGIVGEVYRPLQNKEAFSFFDAVVGEKSAIYHTAGALGDGERVWLLAKLPGYIRVIGDDVAEKYLLLTNTHNGTTTADILFTPVRVVCQNTLNIALQDATRATRKQKVRHTRSIGLRVGDVRKGLGIINERFGQFEAQAQALVKVQLNQAGLDNYFKAIGLLPQKDQDIAAMSTRAKNIIEEVTKMFEHGKGNDLPGVKGTAWGAFNAVTEWVDYVRSTKGGEDARGRQESRATSLLFGSGALLKQKAWDAAQDLVNA